MTLRTRNDSILGRLEPYLVAMPWHFDLLDLEPFGLSVPAGNLIAPTRLDASVFLDRLVTLDTLTFGPEGMPMPRWIFHEASEIPGGIFGFATRAETLSPELRARLELDDDATGLMPLSMYIAIPARPPDVWFGHNLASLNRVLPELELRGLASITKAVALKVYRCKVQLGATQWDSAALHIHTRFGLLELLTAYTPAHSEPATLTYRVALTDERLRHALGDPEAEIDRLEPDRLIAPDDVDTMQAMQREVEAGARFVITGPPMKGDDGTPVVPVAAA